MWIRWVRWLGSGSSWVEGGAKGEAKMAGRAAESGGFTGCHCQSIFQSLPQAQSPAALLLTHSPPLTALPQCALSPPSTRTLSPLLLLSLAPIVHRRTGCSSHPLRCPWMTQVYLLCRKTNMLRTDASHQPSITRIWAIACLSMWRLHSSYTHFPQPRTQIRWLSPSLLPVTQLTRRTNGRGLLPSGNDQTCRSRLGRPSPQAFLPHLYQVT